MTHQTTSVWHLVGPGELQKNGLYLSHTPGHTLQLCKKDARKEKKLKVKSLKRLSKKGRSDDTLGDTTKDILRQCRLVQVLHT
jgi:hypothetical protein